MDALFFVWKMVDIGNVGEMREQKVFREDLLLRKFIS